MPRAELVDVAVDRDTGRRTLVAKRRFEAGEILATDTPLIVWSQNESGLLKSFQASDQQDAILSLYSPALDRQDEKIDERRKKAAALARTKAFSGLDKDSILRVLLIGDAFAHQFGKQSALYETASALRHDCAPNCRFRSQPDGSIEVTSIRHIPAGETLSFSYIGVPWVLCTSERRKLLRESFEFFCACRRCDRGVRFQTFPTFKLRRRRRRDATPPWRRRRDHVSVHTSRQRQFCDGVVPAQVPGPRCITLRPLPRLRQLLCVGGADCPTPRTLVDLLALPRLRQALRRDVMSQRLFPNFKSRRRRRGDATPP